MRAYGYDLLALCRWLAGQDLQLVDVTTEVLLRFLRACREATVAGLMLYCGLRSAEVLGVDVVDVDIGGRWLRAIAKEQRERRVPLDADVASVIQVHLLAERPESVSGRLILVAKGRTGGQPLTAAGCARSSATTET